MKVFTWKNMVIAILVILNVAALSTIWLNGKKYKAIQHKTDQEHRPKGGSEHPNNKPSGLERIFKEELDFSDDQIHSFTTLKEAHMSSTKSIMDSNKELKEQLFNQVKLGDDLKAHEIAEKISNNQLKLELAIYQHFKDIRDICTDKQKEKYELIINEISKRFDKRPPPPRRP